MARLAYGVLRALDPPLRFLLGCLFALAAGLLGVMVIEPGAGYPWPGRIGYVDTGIECLFLGFMLAVSLSRAGCVPAWRPRPGVAAILVFLGLGGAGAISGLVPATGLLRPAALLFMAVYVLRWSRFEQREDVLRSVAFVVFGLILLKYVLPRSVAGTLKGLVDVLPGGQLLWLVFGEPGTMLPPGGDEYRVFLVLLLYAAAVAAVWPERPPAATGAPDPTLLAAPPAPASLPAPEEAPAKLPAPVPALPAASEDGES